MAITAWWLHSVWFEVSSSVSLKRCWSRRCGGKQPRRFSLLWDWALAASLLSPAITSATTTAILTQRWCRSSTSSPPSWPRWSCLPSWVSRPTSWTRSVSSSECFRNGGSLLPSTHSNSWCLFLFFLQQRREDPGLPELRRAEQRTHPPSHQILTPVVRGLRRDVRRHQDGEGGQLHPAGPGCLCAGGWTQQGLRNLTQLTHYWMPLCEVKDGISLLSLLCLHPPGCSGHWSGIHRLHRGHDSFPRQSFLVRHVLLHADQLGSGEHDRNHDRHHHAHPGRF